MSLKEIKERQVDHAEAMQHCATYLDQESQYREDMALHHFADAVDNAQKDRAELIRMVEELEEQVAELAKDRAFFRSCALSGEIPECGSEPSALEQKP